MKKIKNGWTNKAYGVLCQFESCSTEEARRQHSLKQLPHVVETINWTLVDKRTVLYHRYHAQNLSSAIDLAAQIENDPREQVEEVICIRPASAEEILEHNRHLQLTDNTPKPKPC